MRLATLMAGDSSSIEAAPVADATGPVPVLLPVAELVPEVEEVDGVASVVFSFTTAPAMVALAISGNTPSPLSGYAEQVAFSCKGQASETQMACN